MINQARNAYTVLSSTQKAEPVKENPAVLSKTNMTADEKKQLYVKLTQFHKSVLEDEAFPNAKVEFKTIWHDSATGQDSVNIYGNQFRENFFFEILKSSDDKTSYIALEDRVLYKPDCYFDYSEQYPLANVSIKDANVPKENKLYSVPLTDIIPVGKNGLHMSKVIRQQLAKQKIEEVPSEVQPEYDQQLMETIDLMAMNDFKAEDQHYNNLSVLDLLAIIQCEEVSSKDYLNQAIRKINQTRNK